MGSEEVKKKFLNFFKKKDHIVVPSSSLVSDDPSVLLTTAGMQQFKPYYLGKADPEKDFGSKNTTSVQKVFRTSDIDEVGDESHLTFFEMLGNFSFGGYFKKEAIEYAYDFLTKELGFNEKRLSATYLKGDDESLAELKKYLPKKKIKSAGEEDNFWGPTGDEGPCGPTVEFYIDGIEIWNLVFNQYFCQKSGKRMPLDKAGGVIGVDTGMGLERLVAVLNNKKDIYETDLFQPLMDILPDELNVKTKRIIIDHTRGIAALVNDGVHPSNKEEGYILRRLIRRVITLGKGVDFNKLLNGKKAVSVFNEERDKFEKTLAKGLRELEKIKKVDAKNAFKLFESFGLPFEVVKDVGGKKAASLKREDFDKEFEKHREISRAGLERKFGGHGLLLDTGELKAGSKEEIKKVTRLHTATHLLQQALRDVLGDEVQQRGSDINVKRTRFDFSFSRKLTADEIKKVEKIVNKKIKEDLPVKFEEMPIEKAKKTGAFYYFKEKYPDKVKVYYIGKSLKSAYSKEFCGGPHVKHTGEIGEFKINKEESVAAGIRRIRGSIAS